jgi:hypothetical protein
VVDRERRHALPLMRNVAHQQGGVERDRAAGKSGLVGEDAGEDALHGKRLDLPVASAKAHPIHSTGATRRRVADGAFLEEA